MDSFYPKENPFKKKKDDDKAYAGKENLGEEMLEHGVVLDKPLKSHKGKETPEEEAAEEAEIEAVTGKESEEDEYLEKDGDDAKVPLGTLRAELKDLLARLETPLPKRPSVMSLDEKKLPL